MFLKPISRLFSLLSSASFAKLSCLRIVISSSTPSASSALLSSFMQTSQRYLSSQLSQIFSHLPFFFLRLHMCSLQASMLQNSLLSTSLTISCVLPILTHHHRRCSCQTLMCIPRLYPSKRYRLIRDRKKYSSMKFPRSLALKWLKSRGRTAKHLALFAFPPSLPYLFSLFFYNRSTILVQIMKFASKLNNTDRCQHILKLFQQQGASLPHHQLHKFIGRVDRNSLKAQPFFRPLQEMMQQLTPRVVADKFIASNPYMIGSTSFIYCNLNLSSNMWMDYCSRTVEKLLAKPSDFDVGDLDKIYRSFVELNNKNNQGFLKLIRAQIKNRLVSQLKEMENKELYKDQSHFSKRFQFIHKYIRAFLLDQQANIKMLDEVFELFDRIMKKNMLQDQKFDKKNYFGNCAAVFEMMKVYKVKIPQTHYGNFLQKVNTRLKKMKGTSTATNSDKQFQMRGESAFEIRFMKNMHINGYWFDRNIALGINQYDVLLKGKLKHHYYPFANVNLEKLQKGEFSQIGQAERKVFEKSKGFWYLEEPFKLKQNFILNLNGPYHYLIGDQTGLVRYQVVKAKIAEYYGYKDFRTVDYRKWQAQTTNKISTTLFLEKLIGF